MRRFIKKISLPIGMSAFFIGVVFVVFSRPILDFIYNNTDITSYSKVLQILSSIALFSALNMLLVSLFFPAKKEYKIRMKILVSGGVFNLIAAVLAGSLYGIYGIAFAAAGSELFILLLAFSFYKTTSRIEKG